MILEGPKANADVAKRLVMSLMANPWRELAKHWNAPPPPLQNPQHQQQQQQLQLPPASESSVAATASEAPRHLASGEGWVRPPPALPGGHLAGVWRWDDPAVAALAAAAAAGAAGKGGQEAGGGAAAGEQGPDQSPAAAAAAPKKAHEVMPLLVELATDCNVADTWYEAK